MTIQDTTYPDAYLIGQIQGTLRSSDRDCLKLYTITRLIKAYDAELVRRLDLAKAEDLVELLERSIEGVRDRRRCEIIGAETETG